MCTARATHTRGFTLVELLVVVGVIAILIALLMPALSKARRQAQQVACMSNLRQVASAILAYAQAHKGWFPAPASTWREQPEDWVHWQPGRDLSESRIFPFLGESPEVLKCPAGPPERRPPPGEPPYPFNYSVNHRFTGEPGRTKFGNLGGYDSQPCKLSQVLGPSQKILLIDEEVTAANDGTWHSHGFEAPGITGTSVSVRHDRGREVGGLATDPVAYYRAGRGNAAFADGHCEFVERMRLYFEKYTDPRLVP
jgi:prepilin-type N-terminal cleavage/methylation domain-containing protein/prepilin-type processing-associated H-X9-DG protein